MKTWLMWLSVSAGAFFFARWGFSSETFAPMFQQFGETMGINPSLLYGWLMPLMFSTVITLTIVKSVGGVGYVVKRYYRMWDAFGSRLKEAYSVKFGGENSAFNDEVDMHIKGMKTLGRGYTRKIHKDWLKRMAKFVEIPWAIPEEEYFSEGEKTAQFAHRED